jgi:hypothetical protein
MGEPIVDLSPLRASRTIRRVTTNQVVMQMYGDPSFIQEMTRRVQRLAADYVSSEMPGRVVYDVDPVVFDDLIEIRTGGDRSVSLALSLVSGLPTWVSFWPIGSLTQHEVLEGWANTLEEMDTIHQVTVETNSLLEQFLTFDLGYQAAKPDPDARSWRQLTHPRWVEEIREQNRRSRDGGDALAHDPDRGVYRFNSNSGSVNISSVTIAPPSGTSFTERLMAPLPEVVDEPEDDQVEWVADESIMSDDGHAIWVNEHGLDEAGYDPRAPGYRVGLCNCDDCRQVRIDDADVEDDGTDYDYEEDEE